MAKNNGLKEIKQAVNYSSVVPKDFTGTKLNYI